MLAMAICTERRVKPLNGECSSWLPPRSGAGQPQGSGFAELVLRFMVDIVREHHISASIYPGFNRFEEGC
jgi:hypothetical protein